MCWRCRVGVGVGVVGVGVGCDPHGWFIVVSVSVLVVSLLDGVLALLQYPPSRSSIILPHIHACRLPLLIISDVVLRRTSNPCIHVAPLPAPYPTISPPHLDCPILTAIIVTGESRRIVMKDVLRTQGEGVEIKSRAVPESAINHYR